MIYIQQGVFLVEKDGLEMAKEKNSGIKYYKRRCNEKFKISSLFVFQLLFEIKIEDQFLLINF